MLGRETQGDRLLEHAGLQPDGERVIVVPVARLMEVPRGQLLATVVLFTVLVVWALRRWWLRQRAAHRVCGPRDVRVASGTRPVRLVL